MSLSPARQSASRVFLLREFPRPTTRLPNRGSCLSLSRVCEALARRFHGPAAPVFQNTTFLRGPLDSRAGVIRATHPQMTQTRTLRASASQNVFSESRKILTG